MARLRSQLLEGRAARSIGRFVHPSTAVVALAVAAAIAVGLIGSSFLQQGERAPRRDADVTAVATSSPAAPTDVTPAAMLAHDGSADLPQRAGPLIAVQIKPVARAMARLVVDGRFLAVLLGLVLAVVGRRPTTRRPAVVSIPVTAAPGLRVRRRGPPPR